MHLGTWCGVIYMYYMIHIMYIIYNIYFILYIYIYIYIYIYRNIYINTYKLLPVSCFRNRHTVIVKRNCIHTKHNKLSLLYWFFSYCNEGEWETKLKLEYDIKRFNTILKICISGNIYRWFQFSCLVDIPGLHSQWHISLLGIDPTPCSTFIGSYIHTYFLRYVVIFEIVLQFPNVLWKLGYITSILKWFRVIVKMGLNFSFVCTRIQFKIIFCCNFSFTYLAFL